MKLRVLFGLATVLLASTVLFADTIYLYSGNHFTYVDPRVSRWTTDMRIIGSFTLPQPVGPNLNGQDVYPSSFFFDDGIIRLTLSNSNYYNFAIWTDSKGSIRYWRINAGYLIWRVSDKSAAGI